MRKLAIKYLIPAVILISLLVIVSLSQEKENTDVSADAKAIVDAINSSAWAIIVSLWFISSINRK